MPRKKTPAATSPAWQETHSHTRLRLERYPYTDADGEQPRIRCEAMDFWNGEVANALLHDLFQMCHAAQNHKADLDALSIWLDSVFIQIRGVQELDDCDCDAAYGNAIQCACAGRVNKPNEKDNASARLTLLQVLGLISPTAGRIMSNSDILQQLLATKDADPNGLNCDVLSTAFATVQMDGSLGMGFVDRDHVALVNVDCMTVRVAPPERPGSRLVQGFRARCGRRCCCRAGRALRGQGGMRWKGHGEGTAAMRGVPCDAVVYIPLSGPGVGALVALRPALACLSSCSCKASVVCAQAHQHA